MRGTTMFLVTAALLAASWLPFHHKAKPAPKTKTEMNPYALSDLDSAIKWQGEMPHIRDRYSGVVDNALIDALDADLISIAWADATTPEYSYLHNKFEHDADTLSAEMGWADAHSRI